MHRYKKFLGTGQFLARRKLLKTLTFTKLSIPCVALAAYARMSGCVDIGVALSASGVLMTSVAWILN